MAIQIGQPISTLKIAIIVLAKPIIEPTERSNSPAIIGRQAPTSITMNWAYTNDQFSTPAALNMPESCAVSRKKAKTSTVPQIPPSSGPIKASRNRELDLTRSSLG